MFKYPRPPNDNRYLYDLNIDIDKKWCLEYYNHVKQSESTYEDSRPNSQHDNWKIVRIDTFDYADDILEMLGLTGETSDYRPRFYRLEANTILVPHVDLDTKCSLNFVLSKQSAPVTFETDHHFHYKYALFNTSLEHGVINGPEDRILFKISIMDRSFEEVKRVLAAKQHNSYYAKLAFDPLYETYRNKRDAEPKIEKQQYYDLHTSNLIPLPIVIDCDLFEQEIKQFDNRFEQFGPTHTNLERYSLNLTDLVNPVQATPHPANWPMDIWPLQHPDIPLGDGDFKVPNDVMSALTSMQPFMDEFKDDLARCCILKWNNQAHFKPHIDVTVPAANLRLWGTNDPDNNHFCFWNNATQQYEEELNVERGRLYLADTSKYHHAYATADSVYTFFFALQVTSYDKIAKLLQP